MRYRWAALLIAILLAPLGLLWMGGHASSELPATVVTGCQDREMNIFEVEPQNNQTLQEATREVGQYIAVAPGELIVQTLSNTEAEGVFPDVGEASLVVSFELDDGGWAATTVEGCPEFVLTVDELEAE